ncbi:hypothetical protein ABPG75_011653 [Micractinium tetrahymenae]
MRQPLPSRFEFGLWAALGLVLLALALADEEQLCFENRKLVELGTGQQTVQAATVDADGRFYPDFQNNFSFNATCVVSGRYANTNRSRWRMQLALCGTKPCNNNNLLPYTATPKICGQSNCLMIPNSITYINNRYITTYSATVTNAWKGAVTYYYLRCFYVCQGQAAQAQDRAGSSMTLDEPIPGPPPPSPPPSPPSPPPPPPKALFGGIAQATIDSSFMDTTLGVIYAPSTNTVPVTATCTVQGRYAQTGRDNWPAQILACGNPPGSDVCVNTDYDPNVPELQPGKPAFLHLLGTCSFVLSVVYDGSKYIATYQFTLSNALLQPPITYRYFICLYNDDQTTPVTISRRAGASLDVGFDGSRFDYHGTPGTWVELIGSARQGYSLKAKFAAGRIAGTTFMRSFLFVNGTSRVEVELLPPLPGQTIWRLTASANGRPIADRATVPRGISILRVPAAYGKIGRVEINAGFTRVVCIQKWRPNRKVVADFLDVNMFASPNLRKPVTGILGPSYNWAVASRSAVAGAAGMLMGAGSDTPDGDN